MNRVRAVSPPTASHSLPVATGSPALECSHRLQIARRLDRGRSLRLFLAQALLVTLLCGLSTPTPLGAQDNDDRRWVPVPAESLQELTDAIERARAERSPRRERDALLALATRLLDDVPDGGFPIGAGRWIGPGAYLTSAAAALDPAERERFQESLDLLLEARLEREPELSDLWRWLRDLPGSDQFDPQRGTVTAALLEAGRAETWLDLTAAGWPAGVEIDPNSVLRWLRPESTDSAPVLARPYHPVLSARWPTPGDPRSPWSPGAVRVEPILAGDRIYFATPDGVHCWRNSTAEELWFFPFVSDAPPLLPGSIRKPTLVGGTLVVTTENGILGLDGGTGALRFEHAGSDLFPESTTSLEEPDEQLEHFAGKSRPAQSPILSISPPARSERGAVIAASRVFAGSLDLRIILLDAAGRILWNRDAGSAIGATHLALGSVLSAPMPRGDQVAIATGRGAILNHSLIDGALLWGAPYAGFAPSASRDALRTSPRPRDARIEVGGDTLFLTTYDSVSLHGIGRHDGGVRYEIPLGEHRWWAVSEPHAERESSREAASSLLLASPDRIAVWSIEPTGARFRGGLTLEVGLPRFSGPPLAVPDGWWIPHADGAYRLSEEGSIAAIVDLAPPGTIRGVFPAGDRIVITGDNFVELRAPAEPAGNTLAHWWSEISRGEWDALPDPLPRVQRTGDMEFLADEERVARTILWQLKRPGVDATLRRRLIPAAIERIVPVEERVRATTREAIAAEARGEDDLALDLAWRALSEADGDETIPIDPIGAIDLELVIRQVLARLRNEAQELPGQPELERRAAIALRGGRGDRLETRLEVFRRCAGTEVGRRAALEAAEELYRYGNLGYSLELLEQLVLFEPMNAEAVEARLRIVELAREIGNFALARKRLGELRRDYGDLVLEIGAPGNPREVTIAARCDELEETLPDPAEAGGRKVVDLPLEPVWRSRTELEHIRSLRVVPLDDGNRDARDPDVRNRFLTISRRSVELREADRGERLWHTTLPPLRAEDSIPTWSDIGRLNAPIAIDARSVWLTDRRDLLRIDLATGRIVWQRPLPPLEDDPEGTAIHTIEETGYGDGTLLALGNSGDLHAYDAQTGRALWNRPLLGPLEGPIQVQDGVILLGITAPARVEAWSLADGKPLWVDDVESLGTHLAQEPWFIDDGSDEGNDADILIALASGTIRRVDLGTGLDVWSVVAPHLIQRIFRPSETEYWVAELIWSRETPSLIGFDPATGDFLWQKSFPGQKRGLHELIADDGDLYLVDGDFNQRIVACLEVPRVFHREPTGPVEAARELRTRWTQPLQQSWDVPRMRVQQDWILLEDPLNCDLTVLSRETGLPIPPREGFESVLDFLRGRQRLYFAGFIDRTLVLFTARGGMGLRAPDPIGERSALWERLSALPLGDRTPAPGAAEISDAAVTARESRVSSQPIVDAQRAFQEGDTETSVEIIEAAVAEPSLDLDRRRSLLYRLEGINEELGEIANLEWRVPRLEVPPVVDGSLEEAWNAATAWPLKSARYFHPIQGPAEDAAAWRGPRDLSLVLLAAWSDAGFHLALDVDDDNVQAYDKELDYWNGDCLLLAFDFLGNGGTRAGRDDQLYTLALTVPNRQPPGGGAPAGGDGPEGEEPEDPPPEEEPAPEGQFQVQRKADGSGVIYEVLIPWETLREAREQEAIPHPGMIFRLNLVLTDDDTGRAATSYMSLSTGQMLREETRSIWNVFVPDRFPRIILGR